MNLCSDYNHLVIFQLSRFFGDATLLKHIVSDESIPRRNSYLKFFDSTHSQISRGNNNENKKKKKLLTTQSNYAAIKLKKKALTKVFERIHDKYHSENARRNVTTENNSKIKIALTQYKHFVCDINITIMWSEGRPILRERETVSENTTHKKMKLLLF